MSGMPEIVGCDEYSALIVRTDYVHDTVWQEIADVVRRPWGDDGEFDANVHLIDDPVWSGATHDAVVEAASRDEGLDVVFIADTATMQSPHPALLAIRLRAMGDEEDPDPEYYQAVFGAPHPPCEFRTMPAALHSVHVNLWVANMDFEEFAADAFSTPDRVLRPYWETPALSPVSTSLDSSAVAVR